MSKVRVCVSLSHICELCCYYASYHYVLLQCQHSKCHSASWLLISFFFLLLWWHHACTTLPRRINVQCICVLHTFCTELYLTKFTWISVPFEFNSLERKPYHSVGDCRKHRKQTEILCALILILRLSLDHLWCSFFFVSYFVFLSYRNYISKF